MSVFEARIANFTEGGNCLPHHLEPVKVLRMKRQLIEGFGTSLDDQTLDL
jgi:hypothetical protein